MPIYTYRCDNCGHQFDKQQSFHEGPLKACPQCRKRTLYKVYKPAGVVFKGSGFYVTDKGAAKSSTVAPGSSSSVNGKENGASKAKGGEKTPKKNKAAESKD